MSSKKQGLLEKDLSGTREVPVCRHHWVIAKPAGPFSRGTCRTCGEERDFQNYIEGSPWSNDVSLEQLAGGTRLSAGVGSAYLQDDPAADEE